MNPLAQREPRQTVESRLAGFDPVLAVLRSLGHYPRGVGLEQLARDVDGPESSLHRALAALCRAGFVEHDERGSYRLGLELVRSAFAYCEQLDHRQVVELLLEALAGKSAIEFVERLDELDVYWLEEPLAGDDYDGYRRLSDAAAASPLPAGSQISLANATSRRCRTASRSTCPSRPSPLRRRARAPDSRFVSCLLAEPVRVPRGPAAPSRRASASTSTNSCWEGRGWTE